LNVKSYSATNQCAQYLAGKDFGGDASGILKMLSWSPHERSKEKDKNEIMLADTPTENCASHLQNMFAAFRYTKCATRLTKVT